MYGHPVFSFRLQRRVGGRPMLPGSMTGMRMMLVRSAMTLTLAMMVTWFECGMAVGQTLQEALAAAYEANAQLNAQRARLRATDEQVPQALSGYRPSVRAFSEVGPRFQDSNQQSFVGQEDNVLFGRTYGASIEQPLFRGGQTTAAVRGAENTVRAERARLESTEQNVLLNAATAYSDVYRDQAVLEFNIRNEQRLARQLEATRDRFQVGEVTRTDVSQAEARLARATAERIGAKAPSPPRAPPFATSSASCPKFSRARRSRGNCRPASPTRTRSRPTTTPMSPRRRSRNAAPAIPSTRCAANSGRRSA